MKRPARAITASEDSAIIIVEEWQYGEWEGYSKNHILSRCIF
jgi:hypothetical protein